MSAESAGVGPAPMRIAFFVSRFPSLSQTFILRQVTGLLDRGHDVAIFAEGADGWSPIHDEVVQYGLRDRVSYIGGPGKLQPSDLSVLLDLIRTRPGGLRRWFGGHAARYGGRVSLSRKLSKLQGTDFDPDLIHAHFGDVAQRSLCATAVWPVPFVASFYGADCSRLPKQRGIHFYEPLFKQASLITALSSSMEDRLRMLGCPPDRLRRQRIGVDLEEFPFRERAPKRLGRPIRILTVARLVEKKGVADSLRALARLQESQFAFRYDIVGDGPLRSRLEALAESLGISSLVTFHGSADQSAVRVAMLDADLFLLPSVTAVDGDEEGTPTVLMEASASGLPVVSTYHSGIPEVVLDGVSGVLVPEGDPPRLAQAVAYVLRSPERWAGMGRSGRAHIRRNHDTRVLAQNLEDMYRELLLGPSILAEGSGVGLVE